MKKKHIYLLEDDQDIREMIQYLLEEQGYHVSSFASVQSFYEEMGSRHPDLVVMDIWLPDGDGRHVCRNLRKGETTAGLPIILMTASSLATNTDCANDFIVKPFDVSDFMERVGRLLSA